METFLVRIWSSGLTDAPRDEVRGFVERVGHADKRAFVGVGQLIECLLADAIVVADSSESTTFSPLEHTSEHLS